MNSLRSLILLSVASVLIILSACARPNYEEPVGPAAGELGSCDAYFATSDACIDLIWEKKPSENEMGTFVLEFYRRGERGEFVNLANTLEVTLWMPSMGHGSSPVTVEKLAPGQYRVTRVFFIMGGTWEIQLKHKNGNTVLEQAAIPYHF